MTDIKNLQSWNLVALGNKKLFNLIMGQSPPSDTYNDDSIGLPFLQGNADFGDIHPKIMKYCSKPQKIAEIGDILISVRAPVGELNIANEKSCIGRGLAAINVLDVKLGRYLYYYLKIKKSEFDRISAGSTFKAITKSDLEKFEIAVPSPYEYERIGNILTTVDEAIQKSKAVFAETERLKEGTMRKLLTNGVGHTEFKENEKLGFIPKNWEEGTFADIADINPKTDISFLSDDSDITFLPMPNVGENGDIIKYETRTYAEVKTGYTCFAERDVLFAKITPCMENGKGAVAINLVNKIGFGSTEFHVLRAKENADPYFIFYLSKESLFRKNAQRYFTGSAGQQRVSKDIFTSYTIPIIPRKEQTQIVNILSTIDHKLSLQHQRTAALERLKNGLMNDLITSKRSVVIE